MLKVVSFNLRCANDPNGYSIDERAPRLKAILKNYDADLYGFQEVVPCWMEHLTADYGAEYEIFNKYRAEHNLEATPIMWRKSRFECLDKGYFWLSDTPDVESQGWDSWGCYRICLWVKLYDKQDGNTFVFFNTHYGFSDPCQIASGNLILEHMRVMGTDAAILTADFNMRPESAGYKVLAEKLVDVNMATVKDLRTTFHGYHPEEKNSLIDFCFVTPETVDCITSKRMDDTVDGMFPSDHFGVYSEVQIREKLKLMTFNVCCGSPDFTADTLTRATWVRELIKKNKPDVVGLQEVTPKFEDKLSRLSGYRYALKYRGEKALEGTPILWREDKFDLLEEKHFWLSETPEKESKGWDAAYLRIATLVVLQHKGTKQKLAFVNTHFDFSDECHRNSAALLQKMTADYDMPVFYTADFNMQIGSAGHNAMKEFTKDFRELVDITNLDVTFNNLGQLVAPMIIDYVFTNGMGIEPRSYEVVSGLRNKRGKLDYISDHNAILVSFLLK